MKAVTIFCLRLRGWNTTAKKTKTKQKNKALDESWYFDQVKNWRVNIQKENILKNVCTYMAGSLLGGSLAVLCGKS